MRDSGLVLIAAPVHNVLVDRLTALGYQCTHHEQISQKQAYGLVKDCVGIITSTRLQLDKELLSAATQLRWIGRMGSGMEVIDLQCAAARGVACFSSPEGNCNAVGEHALGMLLSLIRRIAWSHAEIKNGEWQREENRGYELEGKTVGIIGYGHTGRSFAKKMQGFDTRILVYDKYNCEDIPQYVTCCDNLNPVFAEADIVSFHVPAQEDTLHYFNRDFISRMKKPFILINTSRGTVVDTEALIQGMADGKVTGACLDVFEQEPVTAMNNDTGLQLHKMLAQPNLVVTPHIAGYTFEALFKMSRVLADKISAYTSL